SKITARGKGGNLVSLRLSALLGCHRLAKAVALTVHLEHVAMMGQTVQQGARHPLPLEDLIPLAERQVARHQHAGTLVPLGEDSEQQLDTTAAQADVAQ